MSKRMYKCLKENIFSKENYTLIPIRDEDKYEILTWRNEQISVLRQKALLTNEQQELYFKTIISELFEQEEPEQILWSLLLDEKLIGYGGLVHIDWMNKRAEISFLTETSRNISSEVFITDWVNYLSILTTIAQKQLYFNSIYTFAYDIRPSLYIALGKQGFKETNRIVKFIEINHELKDAVIHTKFLNLKMRCADINDLELYYFWANDPLVRQNSFNTNEISYKEHLNWFSNKLESNDCFLYVFLNEDNEPIGQVRIDKSNNEIVVGLSIDEKFRGNGYGVLMLSQASNDYLSKFSKEEIVAYIKIENVNSVNMFIKAGYVKIANIIVNECSAYRFKKQLNEEY